MHIPSSVVQAMSPRSFLRWDLFGIVFDMLSSKTIRDVLALISGRLGASVISFISAPFIARLFDPAHYGVAALFVAIAMPASIVLPLSYQNAIVVPKSNDSALALMRLAILITLTLCGLCYTLLGLSYLFAMPAPFADRLGFWVYAVPLAIVILALSFIYEGWLTRTRKFIPSAKATFLQGATTSGGRLFTGAVWGTSVWGLIAPYLAGLVLRLGLLVRATRNDHGAGIQSNLTPLKDVAMEYREFPTYNMPASFLVNLSDSLPVLFFAPVFGAVAAGLYAMADRLIRAPLAMGVVSVRRVYLQRASSILHHGGDLKQSYIRSTVYLALFGLLPLLFLMLAVQPVIEFVLGERWERAGLFAEILAPWMYLMLISRPATALVDLLRQQRIWLLTQICSTLLRVLAMLLAWYWGASEELVLWGFVLGGAPPYMWLIFYIKRLLDIKSAGIFEAKIQTGER